MNNEPLEKKLTDIKNHVALSSSEKGFHRAKLLEHMHKTTQPVPSPFSWMTFASVRYALVALFVVALGGSGVTLASEQSLPGDVLYSVKLKVAEPVRLALMSDRDERVEFEVALAEKRLEEFAVASVRSDVDARTERLIAASFDERLDSVQEHIETMRLSGEGDDAYRTNADLHAVLSAHTRILDTLAVAHPYAVGEADTIRTHLQQALVETEAAEDELIIASAASSEESLDESVDESQEEVLRVLEDLHARIGNAESTLDDGDRATVTNLVDEASRVIDAAGTTEAAGDSQKALQLYVQAEASLDELEILLEGEESLQVDLIEE